MEIEAVWADAIRGAVRRLWSIDLSGAVLEPPSDPKFGDFTCSAPLRLARQLKKPPRAIAEELSRALEKAGIPHLEKVDVAGAGFVNLTAAPGAYHAELGRILSTGPEYGRSALGAGRRVLVEHCSANPTGPLHIAHGRQAAVGDSLSNILDFAGFKVSREFYINDTGNQIEMLGKSILWRLYEEEGSVFTRTERGTEVDEKTGEAKPVVWLETEVDGKRFEILEGNAYRGDYIRALARELRKEEGPLTLERAKRFGKERLLEEIRRDLETFRVRYDAWTSEEQLHQSGKVDAVLNQFSSWGLTYTKNGATYLRTTDFGDVEDRPIVKADGSFVYRLPDMAYHRDKFERGFGILIDLWGPDHHAHIATLKAGLRALNFNLGPLEQAGLGSTLPPDQRPLAFEVLIIQYCRLLEGGAEVKMSKRAASYVTLRELMEEVGVDATRFFFAMRKPSSPLDFDLDVAKKQSRDNPVYYAQYAHARIASINRIGVEEGRIDPADVREGVWKGRYDPQKIGADEIEILKVARQFQRRIEISARDLDPAVLAEYLGELSEAYQRYYDYGRRDASRRVLHEDESLRRAKLAASAAVQTVLRSGFRLLGLSAPDRM
jgi:arginyl-tRNA synthetase